MKIPKKSKQLRKKLEEEDKVLLSKEEIKKDDKKFKQTGFKIKGLLTKLKEKKYKKGRKKKLD